MKHFTTLTCLAVSLIALPTSAHAQSSAGGAAVSKALEDASRGAGGALARSYHKRGFAPLWLVDGGFSPAATRFIELIETADADGLSPSNYAAAELRALLRDAPGAGAEALARAELKFSQELVRYAQDVRKPPAGFRYPGAEMIPVFSTEEAILAQAAAAPSMSEYVQEMRWMSPLYGGLRRAMQRYNERWSKFADVAIPSGSVISEGATGERVGLLRRRLGLTAGEAFDSELTTALRNFQEDHGLVPDGALGPNTVAALNASESSYERKLRLNMDRARTLPGPAMKHVVVNAAEARLSYFGEGEEQGSMRVVVGKPETPTPQLAGTLYYATLNPYWNVPVRLVRTIIAPRMLQGVSLQAMGYEALSDWTADARVIDPSEVDWKKVASGQAQVRVRELPRERNSMGRIKFAFPNDEGIYLHDTPNRALFAKDARQFSNGCVRLEDADRLGEWLFGSRLTTDSSQPEQHLPLPAPVAVYLVYLTAVPTESGVAFLDDVYKQDRYQSAQRNRD